MQSRDRAAWNRSSVARPTTWSRYLGIATACIAIGAALVAFFTAGNAPADLKLLIGFSIALCALTLPLQIEILVRLAERASTGERYSKLLAMIEDYPDLLPAMTHISEASVRTLETSRVEPFKKHVTSLLGEAQIQLEELAQGRLHTAGGDKTLLLSVFANTSKLIQGTTDSGDTSWWRQAIGLEFLELNRDLVKGKRKGKVERVWILEGPPEDATREVISEHRKAGVTVFIVRADQLRDDLLVNMTMMDGWFLHEDVTNRLRRIGEYLFSENHEDLERAESRLRRILAVATPYDGPQSLDLLFSDADQSERGPGPSSTDEDTQP